MLYGLIVLLLLILLALWQYSKYSEEKWLKERQQTQRSSMSLPISRSDEAMLPEKPLSSDVTAPSLSADKQATNTLPEKNLAPVLPVATEKTHTAKPIWAEKEQMHTAAMSPESQVSADKQAASVLPETENNVLAVIDLNNKPKRRQPKEAETSWQQTSLLPKIEVGEKETIQLQANGKKQRTKRQRTQTTSATWQQHDALPEQEHLEKETIQLTPSDIERVRQQAKRDSERVQSAPTKPLAVIDLQAPKRAAKKKTSSASNTENVHNISLAEMEKRLRKPLRHTAANNTLALFADNEMPVPEKLSIKEKFARQNQWQAAKNQARLIEQQKNYPEPEPLAEDDEFAAYYQSLGNHRAAHQTQKDEDDEFAAYYQSSGSHRTAHQTPKDEDDEFAAYYQSSANKQADNQAEHKDEDVSWYDDFAISDDAQTHQQKAQLSWEEAMQAPVVLPKQGAALSSYQGAAKLPEPFQAANTIPPLSLLLPPQHNPDAVQSQDALLSNSITIEEKLAEYRVKVRVLDFYAGPVITRYEIEPDVGVRGSSVLNLEKDLARSLGVAAIRVVETIPGKTCMGLELPNPKRQMIRLSEILNSDEFGKSSSKLTLALGQDITGKPVITDLAKAPHLLVAGTTGSGKSVGVNSMILSMLYKAQPSDVRMIMIDPKMLELSIYEGIPHLLAPVVTDMKLAANALNWCVNEMEKRYRLMSYVGVRNLAGYNQKLHEAAQHGQKINNPFSLNTSDPEPLEKLPYIVVVVDEFADLMMVAGKQIEQLIARLAQKARAAGIHLILATQRPSVDVMTGLIKANIPSRIAFQVSSKIDSRTVLDQMGAENLLGQGDMLFIQNGTTYPQRVHGAFVADGEVHAIVDYLKQFGAPDYIDEILQPEQEELNFGGTGGGSSERDALFDQAIDCIVRTQKVTISSLQRYLKVGYNRAATIIDQLEAEGIVSAADASGKRTILVRGSNDED